MPIQDKLKLRREDPMLRDGTRLSELYDPDRYEVSLRLLSDPEIYRLELERLFGRNWNLLGHESEVANPGDYVMRHIGEDPVLLTRDNDGELHVLLNACTHRGMMICRSEGGKGTQFKCPYHGFTFTNTGRFLGAPAAKEKMWGDVISKEDWGLSKARVDTHAGLVFANFDENAPSLDEWLGDMKWYLDMMYDRSPEGLEVLGPPQRFTIHANWKTAGEQNAIDAYHTLTLHQSLVELNQTTSGGDDPTAGPFLYGFDVSANGHSVHCLDSRKPYLNVLQDDLTPEMTTLERLTAVPPAGMTAEQVPQLTERFDEAQLRLLTDFTPGIAGLFPNVGMFSLGFPLGDEMSAVLIWHVFVPKGPEEFEFVNWYFVEKTATPEMRAKISRACALGFGISGFIETDDADTFPQMTRISKGVMGSKMKMRYHARTGEGTKPDDWPGPGRVYAGFSKDDTQWNWWQRYFELMTEGPR